MNNLDDEKALHMKSGLFSASISGNPFLAMTHDQWIEMTRNKGLKIKGGSIGIANNEVTFQINTKVVNNDTKVKESLKSLTNIKNHQFKYTE